MHEKLCPAARSVELCVCRIIKLAKAELLLDLSAKLQTDATVLLNSAKVKKFHKSPFDPNHFKCGSDCTICAEDRKR